MCSLAPEPVSSLSLTFASVFRLANALGARLTSILLAFAGIQATLIPIRQALRKRHDCFPVLLRRPLLDEQDARSQGSGHEETSRTSSVSEVLHQLYALVRLGLSPSTPHIADQQHTIVHTSIFPAEARFLVLKVWAYCCRSRYCLRIHFSNGADV